VSSRGPPTRTAPIEEVKGDDSQQRAVPTSATVTTWPRAGESARDDRADDPPLATPRAPTVTSRKMPIHMVAGRWASRAS